MCATIGGINVNLTATLILDESLLSKAVSNPNSSNNKRTSSN